MLRPCRSRVAEQVDRAWGRPHSGTFGVLLARRRTGACTWWGSWHGVDDALELHVANLRVLLRGAHVAERERGERVVVEKLVNNSLDDAVLKRAVHRGLDDGETRGPSRMADVRQHVVHLAVLDRDRV